MDENLRLKASFDDNASGKARRLAKTLEAVKPTHGMAQAQKWFKEFRGSADKAAQVVKPISGYMGAIGVGGLAASFSLGEMVKQFKELANQTLALKEIGRQTGLTATEVKQLQYAASQLNIDPTRMTQGLQVLSDHMFDFKRHVGDLYGELNQFDPQFARKLSFDTPEQQIKDIVGWLGKIKDPQLQARWSEAFLGDGGLSRLAAIPGEFDKAWDSAAQKVAPVTAEMEAQAKLLNQSVGDFNASWDNFKNDVGPTVFKELRLAADDFRATFDSIKDAAKWLQEHKDHPVKDALKAGDDSFNAHAEDAHQRFQGKKPWGIGLPKPWTDDLGLTDPNKPWTPDNPYWMSMHDIWTGVKQGAENLNPIGEAHAEEAPRPAAILPRPETPRYDPMSSMRLQAERAFQESRTKDDRWVDPVTNFDGNALRRNDEMPAAQTARELFDKVREGSKSGIIAGLRELAQQQELGGGGGSFGGAEPGHGGNVGMPNLRYGRGASGAFRHGPGAQEIDSNGAFNPRAPEKPGTYRPEYKLSDADLSDYVVNTVNGEATSSAESIDAVINNMMNRVGSKGWGPSGNLRDVASAPGQYAGHRPASPQAAERIRARIRAIASGGVPDNTNGSNAYRAAYYHGKWYQQHAADGRVVGGNRFAYEPWTKNGPFAPYPASKTAADTFAAHARALNGGAPQGHASGNPAPILPAPAQPSAPPIVATPIGDKARFEAEQRVTDHKAQPGDADLIRQYHEQHAQAAPKPLAKFADGGHVAGPGGPRSDSIFAMLSNREFVVNAAATQKHLPLLEAINSGRMPAFADGGLVAAGMARHRSWLNFFTSPPKAGGMGAPTHVGLGAVAMMMGESGRWLNPRINRWDVNGPSIGTAQWHDVAVGPHAGPGRATGLINFARKLGKNWSDVGAQQQWWKHEAMTTHRAAWKAMLQARTAVGTLRAGIDKFEVPADKPGELHKRMPNIIRLARESAAVAHPRAAEIDPIRLDIHHHENGRIRSVRASGGGKGVQVHLARGPTFASASETN